MLAMLGGFFFEINSNGYQELTESLRLPYAEHKKAQGFTHHEAVGKYEENFEMKGTLILENIYSLELLKLIAKNKEPILLVFGSGFAYWVIIKDLEIDSSRFLVGGGALKRKFKVCLERYYYEESIFGSLFSAFR